MSPLSQTMVLISNIFETENSLIYYSLVKSRHKVFVVVDACLGQRHCGTNGKMEKIYTEMKST